ncbi:hypothetical protein QJS10_CPA16g00785 [Acorus calamus]|uniref:Calmodulin n=1 Tax=Acorus calamus TaxID=4465 RepID=A0AAV9D178_ACOCL|nr:hypothetical protein QJS10_CPA16g00785 [Acorus calamus]
MASEGFSSERGSCYACGQRVTGRGTALPRDAVIGRHLGRPTTPPPPVVDEGPDYPEWQCRCGRGACRVLTSRTAKNPGRKFYTCPVGQGACKFFQWVDAIERDHKIADSHLGESMSRSPDSAPYVLMDSEASNKPEDVLLHESIKNEASPSPSPSTKGCAVKYENTRELLPPTKRPVLIVGKPVESSVQLVRENFKSFDCQDSEQSYPICSCGAGSWSPQSPSKELNDTEPMNIETSNTTEEELSNGSMDNVPSSPSSEGCPANNVTVIERLSLTDDESVESFVKLWLDHSEDDDNEISTDVSEGNNQSTPPPTASEEISEEDRVVRIETEEEREGRIRSLFGFFDASNSGYLDYANIEAGLSALQIPAEYKYARDLISVCDSNRDGRVDYGEFRRYMDDKELELYRIFQAIDVEHNGCILPEELWDALVKAGIEIDDEELAHFVDHVDKDNNGIITFEEWRDFLLLYPHEATIENITITGREFASLTSESRLLSRRG